MEMNDNDTKKCGVFTDGTWQRQGYSYGVFTAVSLKTKSVLMLTSCSTSANRIPSGTWNRMPQSTKNRKPPTNARSIIQEFQQDGDGLGTKDVWVVMYYKFGGVGGVGGAGGGGGVEIQRPTWRWWFFYLQSYPRKQALRRRLDTQQIKVSRSGPEESWKQIDETEKFQ